MYSFWLDADARPCLGQLFCRCICHIYQQVPLGCRQCDMEHRGTPKMLFINWNKAATLATSSPFKPVYYSEWSSLRIINRHWARKHVAFVTASICICQSLSDVYVTAEMRLLLKLHCCSRHLFPRCQNDNAVWNDWHACLRLLTICFSQSR